MGKPGVPTGISGDVSALHPETQLPSYCASNVVFVVGIVVVGEPTGVVDVTVPVDDVPEPTVDVTEPVELPPLPKLMVIVRPFAWLYALANAALKPAAALLLNGVLIKAFRLVVAELLFR